MQPFVNIHTHHPRAEEINITCFGIHPWKADVWNPEVPIGIPNETEAIGEIGLDYAALADPKSQIILLRRQLQIAEERRLPVILHCVKAFEPLMKELESHTLRAVIFHGFIGSVQQAQSACKRGYYLSFGERSMRSPRTVDALRQIPLDRLFLETDECPAPIAELYEDVAVIRGMKVCDLQKAIMENYQRIFCL